MLKTNDSTHTNQEKDNTMIWKKYFHLSLILNFICFSSDKKSRKLWSSQLWTQFEQLQIEAWRWELVICEF